MRKLSESKECEVAGCDKKSEYPAYSRILEKVVICCLDHANEITDERYPEYHEICPNCNCRIPVN